MGLFSRRDLRDTTEIMTSNQRSISFAGSSFQLDPSGALYWPEQHLLIVADLHLGRLDMPATADAVERSPDAVILRRLSRLVRDCAAERLLILGDLVHGASAVTPDLIRLVAEWRKTVTAEVLLVRGNYDHLSAPVLNRWDVEPAGDVITVGSVRFRHKPGVRSGEPEICGHLHPCVRLPATPEAPALPCFVMENNLLLMPSFGSHQDGYEILEKDARTFFVLCDGEVRTI